MQTLGAPLRHFGFNRGWAVFFGFGTLMFGTVAVVALTLFRADFEIWQQAFAVALTFLNVFVLLQTVLASATVCEMGLRYKTLRGQGEMLWEDVEKFRYSVTTTYHGIIKTARYSMKLLDKDGRKAELGSNVEHPQELAAMLWSKLQAPLFAKLLAAYESGQIVDLGEIKVSREGFQIKIGLRKVAVPTANIAGCWIENGVFNVGVSLDGKIKNYGVFMRSVDNVFPLIELINSKIVQQQTREIAFGASAGR